MRMRAAIAFVISLAACGTGGPGRIQAQSVPVSVAAATSTSTPAPGAVTPTSAGSGGLAWKKCGSLECTTLAVPLDYGQPSGPTIAIAISRRGALDPAHRLGALVINPGGPGDSGVDDLPAELRILTNGLQRRFDIVSFDPRGVGRSAPVRCGTAAGPPGPVPDPVPQDDAAAQRLFDAAREYANACSRLTGAELGHVGTADAARDLDRIRAALGDDRLTFIGHSYGTFLGATYADLFPDRVRALFLDGAIDPALSTSAFALDQAKGFEASLAAFAAWCASNACPWKPNGDPRQAILALVDQTRGQPMPAGRRTLGPGEVYLGTIGGLYSQSKWPGLGQALGAAQSGDGAPLLAISDRYQTHGSSNAVDANSAVNCLDHPVPSDVSSFKASADAAGREAPLFGPPFEWGTIGCAVWPVPPTLQAHRVAGPDVPIVVVGTSADPATPHDWAASLAAQLRRGVLVTRQGVDHVAYYYSSCVRALAERYLVDLAAPASGTTCSS